MSLPEPDDIERAREYIVSAARRLHDVVKLASDDNALMRRIHDDVLRANSDVIGALFALDEWREEQERKQSAA